MTVFKPAAIALWAALACAPAPSASAPAPSDSIPSPPPVRAARLTEPLVVDGDLSEHVWQNGNAVSGFRQRDPVEGAQPSQRTEVRVAYDDDALYVGARMYDSAPDSILARLTRRDVSIPADRFSVYLDPFHDRRSGYYFLVNAAGTLFDGTLSNDGWEDSSWDGVWEAKVRRDPEGWTAEFRIPYSQLRFERGEQYVWGVNFRRVVARHSEEDFLVYQPKNGSGFVSRFPDLVGIEGVRAGRSIEVLPYMTTKAAYVRHDSGDPFHDGSDYKPSGGGDLRMALGSRLTLNATVNPDFGQVEVDPAVVNLSDFETFFPEKRPFFVEGSSNFNFGQEGANSYWGFNWPGPTFFYSRRIGRAPQRDLPDEVDFADVPAGTSILGASKVTGKLSPSVNVGTLHALTGRERARIWNGSSSHLEVEPLTYYGVGRALKEFPGRRAGLGTMATAVVRRFDDPVLRDELNSGSFLAGTDGWLFLDDHKNWVLSGWSAASHVRGSREAMLALQESSRRYYQRPDAGHVEVDADATSLTGAGSRYWLNRQNGNMIMNAALGFMTPGFEVNDLGFQTRTDVINAHVGGGYKWTKPTRTRKHQDVIVAVWNSFDFDGNRISTGAYAEGNTELANNHSWNYYALGFPGTLSNRRTRGGPLTWNPYGFEGGVYFDTDSKQKLFFSANLYHYNQPAAHTYTWTFTPGVEWKPASNVTVSAGPGLARVRENAQYVATVGDPLAAATYGSRYVFAVLDQKELSANLRLNWAFSPTLCLQLYLQPLLSAGDYSGYKELARPRSYEFTGYGGVTETGSEVTVDPDGPGPAAAFALDQPDFNYASLRGNAVLRWEFLPGSALFVVWTHEREDSRSLGGFEPGAAMERLLAQDADNIFLAKVSYYFGF